MRTVSTPRTSALVRIPPCKREHRPDPSSTERNLVARSHVYLFMAITRNHQARNLAAAVVVAGCGAACAAPLASAQTTTPRSALQASSTLPQCSAGQLRASLQDISGTAGGTASNLTLTNVSSHACSVRGFPGVSYRDAAGQQVGAAARRVGGARGILALAPGASAKAGLMEADPLNYPSATCHLTRVNGLRVYPPNQTGFVFIHRPGRACANRSLEQLSIRAL